MRSVTTQNGSAFNERAVRRQPLVFPVGNFPSLRRHYGWDFAELDRRWQRYAFPSQKSGNAANGGGG